LEMGILQPSRSLFGLFAAMILTSGVAAADTIIATGTGLGEDIWFKVNGTDQDSYAGLIDISLTNSTGTYAQNTFCVQATVDISPNVTYNTTVELPSQVNWSTPPPTNAALEQVAWMIDNDEAGANSNVTSAALQLAIWKVAEDGVYTYAAGVNPFLSGIVQEATGAHTTNATVLSDAESYLKAASGESSNLANVYVNVAQTGNPPAPAQMLEGIRYADTPESSTFVLAGIALLALGQTARRKLGSR
jgi:hypothetical protein